MEGTASESNLLSGVLQVLLIRVPRKAAKSLGRKKREEDAERERVHEG